MRYQGSGIEFNPISLQSAGSAGNYSSAAAAVDIGNSYKAQREKAPRYDVLSAEAMKNTAAENVAAMESEASAIGTGLSAFSQAKGSLLSAQGEIKAAKAAAAGKQGAAGISAIGGIIGTGIKLLSGGMA